MNYTINATICREAESLHPKWKDAWYGLNQTYRWGCVAYLYKKYGRPDNYQAFYDYYVTDITGEAPQTYGRSEDYIYEYAEALKEKSGENYPTMDYYNYIVKKLIVDTLDGAQKENEAAQFIKEQGYTLEEPTYLEDKDLGIDLKAYKDGKLKFMVQVKPHTFFLGNNNKGLLNDRNKAVVKEKSAKKIYGVPVYYMVYNKRTGDWITHNGHKALKLNDLLNNVVNFKQW